MSFFSSDPFAELSLTREDPRSQVRPKSKFSAPLKFVIVPLMCVAALFAVIAMQSTPTFNHHLTQKSCDLNSDLDFRNRWIESPYSQPQDAPGMRAWFRQTLCAKYQNAMMYPSAASKHAYNEIAITARCSTLTALHLPRIIK